MDARLLVCYLHAPDRRAPDRRVLDVALFVASLVVVWLGASLAH